MTSTMRTKSTRAFTLTQLIEEPRFKRHFKRRMPFTRNYITLENGRASKQMLVPPSDWTSKNRYGIVGSATEYAVALETKIDDLANLCSRCARARGWRRPPFVISDFLFLALQDAINTDAGDRWQNVARTLCFLAECDALFRQGASDLEWVSLTSIVDGAELRGLLNTRYPNSVSDEIRRCTDNGVADIHTTSKHVYGPVFSGDFDGLRVAADGDFLLDTCLVDMKVRVRDSLRSTDVWQVLGYAILDAARQKHRIKEVAIYNPRCRSWWNAEVETLAQRIADRPFSELAKLLISDLRSEVLAE